MDRCGRRARWVPNEGNDDSLAHLSSRQNASVNRLGQSRRKRTGADLEEEVEAVFRQLVVVAVRVSR